MGTIRAGLPCWVDLGSPDVEASKRFYGELFGWTSTVAPEAEAAGYTTFHKDGKAVAAVGQLMDERQQPAWTTYFASADADATTARVEGIFGTIVMRPMDVLGYGRMALFLDTTGAPFGVWQPGSMRGEEVSGVPGSRSWSELMTGQPDGAKEFYADVLGWRSQDVGHYTIFQVGDAAAAGMAPAADAASTADLPPHWQAYYESAPDLPPHWTVYFEVDDPDAVAATAARLGGSAPVGPTDSPAGRFALLADPHGAPFSVISSNPEFQP